MLQKKKVNGHKNNRQNKLAVSHYASALSSAGAGASACAGSAGASAFLLAVDVEDFLLAVDFVADAELVFFLRGFGCSASAVVAAASSDFAASAAFAASDFLLYGRGVLGTGAKYSLASCATTTSQSSF